MRTSSDNHKAINDYLDSFYGSFLGNEKTRDAAAEIIYYSMSIDDTMREIYEIAASFRDSKQ